MTVARPETRLVRAAVVRVYDVANTTVIVGPDGRAHALADDSARLARALLAFLLEPRTRAEIIAQVERLVGAAIPDPAVIDELLALLEATEVLRREAPTPPRPRGQASPRLVLGLAGAIASALTPALVGSLIQRGFEVRVVATRTALRFVSAEVLAALVHQPVLFELQSESEHLFVPHIELAQWADAVLLCPASATTIARLASGDHSTLVSALALATRAPVMIVPSMNVDMYAQPAVQRNLRQLVADGFHLVHPGAGDELATRPAGRVATLGPMPPHAVVVDLLEAALRIERIRNGASKRPRTAAQWDELFRTHPAEELAWHTEELDEDIAAALEAVLRPGARVLDIGTGLGVAAVHAARRGCWVVATDISKTALERARERADGAPVIWLRDDITDSSLGGEFDVLIDRGCLHLLDGEQSSAYAAAVARLTAPGGTLLIKTHAPSEGDRRGTRPYDAAALTRRLGADFELLSDQPGRFAGPGDAPEARLFVLSRTAR